MAMQANATTVIKTEQGPGSRGDGYPLMTVNALAEECMRRGLGHSADRGEMTTWLRMKDIAVHDRPVTSQIPLAVPAPPMPPPQQFNPPPPQNFY